MTRVLLLQHAPSEGGGTFETLLAHQGIEFERIRLDAGVLCPENLEGYSGLISMGGPMGVYEQDQFAFMKPELGLMQKALAQELPVLGICLGSQMLAAAAGAKVYPAKEKEIGWFSVWLKKEAKEDVLLARCPEEFMAFHWHGDTFDLPPGAVLLASSHRTAHQAFRIGSSAWGLQFHPEVTPEMISDWVKVSEGDPAVNATEIVSGLSRFVPSLEQLAQSLFLPFCQRIKKGPLNHAALS